MTLTAIFTTVTLQLGLPPNLLSSLCFVETRHVTHAIHLNDGKGHSFGVCQIKINSARLMGFKGTEEQLMDPKVNIYYAGKYLKHQMKRYKGSIQKAVIAYNMGSAKALTSTKYQARVFEYWRQNASN